VYPCDCSRKAIAEVARLGIEGPIYPGTCRQTPPNNPLHAAWRLRTDQFAQITFEDRLQGTMSQQIEAEIGDFVVKRADSLFAYQLAVVMDDAFQGITDVVRGCDLLTSTARQIALQNVLNLPTPRYVHLPIALNPAGKKLSKQTLANPVDTTQPVETLWQVLVFLQQQPPASLRQQSLTELWRWAIENWRLENLVGLRSLPATTNEGCNGRQE
jgi:glutamyl-Q tRNA(Asp) synthetase